MPQSSPETEVPEPSPRRDEGDEAKRKGWNVQAVKVVAALLTTFGSGAVLAFYLAGVGFFVVQFKSRTILLWMLLAAYGPFPLALWLQVNFDGFFDKMHGTKMTFCFRVMALPVLMAVVLGVLAFLCTLWVAVLICGLLLGFMYASTIASSLQMVSSWEPILVVWAQMGNTVGSSTAVIAFFIFSFRAAEASTQEFRTILLVPIGIVVITSSILMYWHFKEDMFEHVYRRLAYDLLEAENAAHNDAAQNDFPPLLPMTRGTSADAPVYARKEVDSLGVPLWAPWYAYAGGLSMHMSFLILPFATYFGDADLAQTLVLSKFAMDCCGRLTALIWGYLNEEAETRHALIIFQLISRLLALVLLALMLLRIVPLYQALFLTLWCFFYWDAAHLTSQIDIIVTRCTVVAQRKAVSRRNACVGYAGLLLALLISVGVVFAFNLM